MNSMLKTTLILLILLMFSIGVNAQIGIGTITPDPNAVLDLESTTQGVLIPRMTKAQRELIGGGSPATGLLVYQTDDATGFYFYNGAAWTSLSSIKPSGLETLDEGNGNGLVRVERDPANYGNVGQNAVDLSFSNSASTTYGATGGNSTAFGGFNEASGAYSTAMGRDTKATGNYSTAMGRATLSSGVFSVAMGVGTIASGSNALAIGQDSQAIGSFSNAFGFNTEASGEYSTATGNNTNATGDYSTAMGDFTEASGSFSTAMGGDSQASGDYSTAMGFSSLASGNFSTAFGLFTQAQSYASTAIGRYNVGGGTPASFTATDPLFEIGNGSSNTSRSNAMTVLKNGNVGIGITSPTDKLVIDGGRLEILSNTDATGTTGTGSIEVGNNLRIDNNEIITNSNTPLFLQQSNNGNLGIDNGTFYVDSSNNRVGIGTTSPSQALDIVGNAEINGNAVVTGNVNANGHLYGKRIAFSAYTSSDIVLGSTSTVNLWFSDVTDPYNSFNGTYFTAPRSGLYFFGTSVSFHNGDNLDDTMWMGFLVNNTTSSSRIVINPRAFTSFGREQTYSHTMVLSLSAGQIVSVQLTSVSTSTPVRVLNRTFTGYYLGDL